MRIGVSLTYWPWAELEDQIDLACLADDLGFDSVWVAETWGQEAVALLGHLTAVTEQIDLCAAVVQVPARTPTAVAMAAATLHDLSGGRVRLGLGLSGPQVSEGWYGVPFTAPLGRTRDCVDVIRSALSGRHVEHAGKHVRLPLGPDEGLGLGKALRLLLPPAERTVPIYLGVSGPATVRQAGEIADGWIPFLFDPAHADEAMAPLLEGLAASGRERSAIDVAPLVTVSVADDVATARDAVRPFLAFYLGAMGAADKNFYVEMADRRGYGESARLCQKRFLAGDRDGAQAALSDDLIDLAAITTTEADLGQRLKAYEDCGVDTLIAVPFGDKRAVLAHLARHL